MSFELDDRVEAATELTKLALGPQRWVSCTVDEAQEGTWETFQFFLAKLSDKGLNSLRPEKPAREE